MGAPVFTRSVISEVGELRRMIDLLADCGKFAFDTETRSVDFEKDPEGALKRMTMRADLASFAVDTGQSFTVCLGMRTMPNVPEEVFFEEIKTLMEDKSVLKVGWNFIFDAHLYANYNVWVQHFEDAMVMGFLLDENRGNGLKERCSDVDMSLSKFPFKDYWKARQQIDTGERLPRQTVYTTADLAMMEAEYVGYAAEDSEATILLREKYLAELEKAPRIKELFYGLRNPLVRTLFQMERRGVPVDSKYLERLGMRVRDDIDTAEREVYSVAGRPFKIGSTKELGQVLYNEMGLPVFKTTGKGANSTDAGTLSKLAMAGFPIAQALLKWRECTKLAGTYTDPDSSLRAAIYPWSSIHSSFHPCGARTGRLSSSDPNMQNIVARGDYDLRSAFIAHKGHILVGGDFSQIELRVMAHMSGDPAMIAEYCKDIELWKAFNSHQDGKGLNKSDIHQSTADGCRCTRNVAKGVNFGNLYGIGPRALGEFLTQAHFDHCLQKGIPFDPVSDVVTEEMAAEFISLFFQKYAGIRRYQDAIGERLRRLGYVETRWGQRRRLPDIYSGDRYLIGQACRQAVNVTIQGHVGELMAFLMNKVEQDRDLRLMGYRLFLQVHDEILGECPVRHEEDARWRLTEIFQNPMESTDAYPYAGYRVPLIFEAKSGPTWAAVH